MRRLLFIYKIIFYSTRPARQRLFICDFCVSFSKFTLMPCIVYNIDHHQKKAWRTIGFVRCSNDSAQRTDYRIPASEIVGAGRIRTRELWRLSTWMGFARCAPGLRGSYRGRTTRGRRRLTFRCRCLAPSSGSTPAAHGGRDRLTTGQAWRGSMPGPRAQKKEGGRCPPSPRYLLIFGAGDQ